MLPFSHFRRLSGEAAWVFIGQLTSIIGSLVLIRVLTHYLSPSDYGVLALALTAAGLVNQVLMGGLAVGISRFYPIAVERHDLHPFYWASGKLLLCSAASVFVLGLLIIGWQGLTPSPTSIWLTLLVIAFSLSSGFSAAAGGMLNAARKRKDFAIVSAIETTVRISFVAICAASTQITPNVVVAGYLFSSLVALAFQVIFLSTQSPPSMGKKNGAFNWCSEIWTFSWPFSIWGIFTWAQQVSDRWALQVFDSAAEVGVYAVAFQLAYTPMTILTGIVATFLSPILFQRSGDATNSRKNLSVHLIIRNTVLVGIFLSSLVVLITLTLRLPITNLFTGRNFTEASRLLPYLVWAGSMMGIAQVLALKFLADLKTTLLTIVKIVTALLGVGLNFLAASHFGALGVAAAVALSATFYLLTMAALAFRRPPIQA